MAQFTVNKQSMELLEEELSTFYFYVLQSLMFAESWISDIAVICGISQKEVGPAHLNNRVFLSRNYGLIVAPQKFDVLKTNICPRSEASRSNMLVLRTSNLQGATIRPIIWFYQLG